MNVTELAPGLWRWTATHPEWTEEEGGQEGWEPEVSSYALVEEDALVLIDPLVPADDEERFWRALDDDVEQHGPPQIVLGTPLQAADIRLACAYEDGTVTLAAMPALTNP